MYICSVSVSWEKGWLILMEINTWLVGCNSTTGLFLAWTTGLISQHPSPQNTLKLICIRVVQASPTWNWIWDLVVPSWIQPQMLWKSRESSCASLGTLRWSSAVGCFSRREWGREGWMEPSCRSHQLGHLVFQCSSGPKPQFHQFHLFFPEPMSSLTPVGSFWDRGYLSQCSYALRGVLHAMTIQEIVTAHSINYFHFSFAFALVFAMDSVLLPWLSLAKA